MAVSGVSTSGLNFTGLATGIDTAKIIDGLTAISQKRIDAYKSQQSDIVTKQTAFATLQANLFDLQSKTNALARSGGGAFDGRLATTSDSTAVTAVAGTAAVSGTYSLTVKSLAQAGQIASTGYSDPNAAIKTGALTIQVGTGTATTVTIDNQNNTLQGLADAVNAAGGDVRASVVNDGTGATPYRLLLTSAKTGTANSIIVSNDLATDPNAVIKPTSPTNPAVQAASDAQVTVGTGAGALTVSSTTNQVNNLIPGVSLNLLTADPIRSISVTVKKDTDSTVKAVQDFVASYNAVQSFLTDQTKYDPATQTAGLLLGNSDVAALSDQLSSALSATVPGLSSGANRLSSVGLAFGTNNQLTFDSAKLTTALAGTTPPDFKSLFALSGTSDTPGATFLIGGNNTKPTSGTPYGVRVTTPATRAVVTATDALPSIAPQTIDGSTSPPTVLGGVLFPTNNSLQLKLNGLLSNGVSIPSGPYYDAATLIAAVQKAINAAPSLGGNLISASLNGSGKLDLTTQAYGTAANVAITGGTPALLTALGFHGTEAGTGTDVVGSFVANGVTETATGSGQVLIGAAGNANTDGLQVTSTLPPGGSANVTVSQGLASRLGAVLNKYLDPTNGRFKTINDGFNQQNKDITATIDKQNAVLAAKTADLQSQFAAMETAVNNLKGIQAQLSSFAGTPSTHA